VDFIGVPPFTLTQSQIQYVHSSETMTHPRNYYRTRTVTLMADWFKARRLDTAAIWNSPLLKLFLGGGTAFAELSREISLKLYELFRPEVEEIETLRHRDFSRKSPKNL
jgi:hypothetical protein